MPGLSSLGCRGVVWLAEGRDPSCNSKVTQAQQGFFPVASALQSLDGPQERKREQRGQHKQTVAVQGRRGSLAEPSSGRRHPGKGNFQGGTQGHPPAARDRGASPYLYRFSHL